MHTLELTCSDLKTRNSGARIWTRKSVSKTWAFKSLHRHPRNQLGERKGKGPSCGSELAQFWTEGLQWRPVTSMVQNTTQCSGWVSNSSPWKSISSSEAQDWHYKNTWKMSLITSHFAEHFLIIPLILSRTLQVHSALSPSDSWRTKTQSSKWLFQSDTP